MTAGAAGNLDAVPLRVTDPQRIPSQRYYDEEFFKLERDKLWPHVWQMACRLEEIPNVGDYAEYRILDKSVLVIRTKSGIKAFHNACRHRGVQLASGHGNCKVKGLICPFHGWRFNMDGKNTFVFAKQVFDPSVIEQAELDLAPCRVELWGGSAFINFDDNAPPLLECLGPVAERLSARNVEDLKMEWWYATVLPTNWKLAMEAFMEGYHTMKTHPQLQALSTPEMNPYGPDAGVMLPTNKTTPDEFVDVTIRFLDRLSSGMAGMVHSSEVEIAHSLRNMELPDDMMGAAGAFYTKLREEITTQGQARGLPVPDLNELAVSHEFHAVEYMFPHYFLLPMFGAMSSYRIRPLTPETCIFEIFSLAFLPDDENRAPVRPIVLPHESPDFPEIPRQDYDNLPLQQLGLHAGGFDHMRLSNQVEGMISNYQRLIDGYLAELDPQVLAKGQAIVNCGFEAPIRDIGFGPGPKVPAEKAEPELSPAE
ncbi:aromatic ring-hydroxylating oxygenase subunit alpha [Sphingomonas solaris]|uniref:Aromatic ring-hydroxylating dioxygenase subunit alpha n=1 Tax=Alterirhizorhabdus solaris TaxID=2529389 RepID=A0A558RB40_9SPHN|nr:aromatic ring-hydroxylating dioxygenase subunit alpha [Sphingomonas solaris]TVV76629.1 aromatic ring-hydroxylating dioxygenase subunit alpha [Sphingomonas solaris]